MTVAVKGKLFFSNHVDNLLFMQIGIGLLSSLSTLAKLLDLSGDEKFQFFSKVMAEKRKAASWFTYGFDSWIILIYLLYSKLMYNAIPSVFISFCAFLY